MLGVSPQGPCAHRVEVHEPSQARAVLEQREAERLLQLVVILVLFRAVPKQVQYPLRYQQVHIQAHSCRLSRRAAPCCTRLLKASSVEREAAAENPYLLPGVCWQRSACTPCAVTAAPTATGAGAAAEHLLAPGAKVVAVVAAAPSPAPPATLTSSADNTMHQAAQRTCCEARIITIQLWTTGSILFCRGGELAAHLPRP